MENRKENLKKGIFCHLIIMFALVLIVFWNYLIGRNVYIFTDIATDSAGQTYPNLVYLAREISAGNFMNRWNFSSSIGNTAEMILPKLANLEAFFGVKNVAYFMGFNMAIKVFFSGIFFYLYLKQLNISNITSSIFSIFYAFCAQMIIRGTWRSYPNEVLIFAIWLYAYESWFHNRKNWWKLIFASVFLYFNSSGYYVALYTGIFVIYIVFRVIIDWDKEQPKINIKDFIIFIGAIICALFISTIGWLNSITTQLKSDRFTGGTNKLSTYQLSNLFTDFDTLKTAFYRTIGTDILGISDFKGIGNFLEAPAFYCGILTLILLPAIFIQAKGGRKLAYSIGLLGIMLYIFVRPVRFVANGLAGHSFKLASLWVMVLLLYISANGIDSFLERRDVHKARKVIVSYFVIVGMSVFCIIDGMSLLKLGIVLLLMGLYTAVIYLYNYGKWSSTGVKAILLLIAITEVLLTSYGCVNNRGTMVENIYEDGTIEALEFIEDKNGEKDQFYRVDKHYQALSYCDALYQNFMGTVGYIGGSGDRKSTGDFYQAVSMAILGGSNHGMTGFATSTRINSLMNVKYILSNAGMNTNFGYKELGKVGNITVYENQYALPLGYVYDKYINLEDYLKLPVEDRRNVLMEMCVLDGEYDNAFVTETTVEHKEMDIEAYIVDAETEITEAEVKVTFPQRVENIVCLVKLDAESEGTNISMMKYYNYSGQEADAYLGVQDGRDEYYLEFNDSKIEQLRIFNTHKYNIKEIKVYQIPKEVYYESYIKYVNDLMESGLKVEKIDCNMITGTMESSKNGMMTFTIPYDVNWHVYIDGVENELIPINIAMMGTTITEGIHEIQLIYKKEAAWRVYVVIGFAILSLFIFGNFVNNRRSVH